MLVLIAGMFALAAVGIALSSSRIVAEVPREDRQYMDPPPRFYRLTWPLVRLVSHYSGWALSKGAATRIQQALRRAGQDYTLTPVQFFAGKLVASGMVAALMAWAMSMLSQAVAGGAITGAVFGYFLPELWLSDMTKARNLKLLKALPFFLDIVTMAVEAGLSLGSALQQALQQLPPGPLVNEINRLLREVRAGKPRTDALRDMAARLDFRPISSLVSALVQGELMGSSIGPILRAQSEQRRTERFQRAEKLALEAPVKMLGPLILCIFPCTFIVIAFPIVVQLLSSGL
ncbi:MAG TPA: type II secretion system F family protein [Burkholderiaceae bacterium]|jgi:tight adherence protein C|nr:type II secretion system F family protein [Burkholderiaceae bacterium]